MKDYHSQYKEWILHYFREHQDDMISASSLLTDMHTAGINVNQATVYRNLERLEEKGQIRGHHLNNHDEKYYQYLSPEHDCSHHLHLYCRKCGRVIHLDCDFMNEIQDHLLSEHGFSLDCGDSMLVGICEECRKEENA